MDSGKADFDPRDRADHRQTPQRFDGRRWHYGDLDPGHTRMRLMARAKGYIMVRKPGAMPFVLTEKEWAAMPLFVAPSPLGSGG